MRELQKISDLELICHEIRRNIFEIVLNAGSGHIGGCSSSVEIMVALYFGNILRFDPLNPKHPRRDRVLVRGHLGPLRYSLFSLLGWIQKEELTTYRSLHSRLQGHECMDLVPGVDITPSGMLGMLLSYGIGSAIALKNQGLSSRVWVFLGDGEEQEGNVSEAARHASNIKLNNLVCVMDCNKKQLSQRTSEVDGGSDVAALWKAYGWTVHEIQDGHSIADIINAFKKERVRDKPNLFIVHTIKGKGLKGAEDHPSGYHSSSTCPKKFLKKAIAEQQNLIRESNRNIKEIVLRKIQQISPLKDFKTDSRIMPFVCQLLPKTTDLVEKGLVDFFQKLVNLFRKFPEYRLYVLTADVTVKNLAHLCGFDQKHVRYIDVGIREQHLIAMAHGISVTDPSSRIIVVEGDPFLFRAIDQINAISQARSKMIIIGADSGVCEARNGETHQTIGQPGALINIPMLTFLEPANVTDLVDCLNWSVNKYSGPTYLRLHSGKNFSNRESVQQSNLVSYTVYQPQNKTKLIIVSSGLTVKESIDLAEKYDRKGIGIKVINVVNMKTLDSSFVNLLEENVPVLTVYNGNPFILQSAIAKVVMQYKKPRPSIIRGHGFTKGTTGSFEDLIQYYLLDASGIEQVIKKFFGNAILSL